MACDSPSLVFCHRLREYAVENMYGVEKARFGGPGSFTGKEVLQPAPYLSSDMVLEGPEATDIRVGVLTLKGPVGRWGCVCGGGADQGGSAPIHLCEEEENGEGWGWRRDM